MSQALDRAPVAESPVVTRPGPSLVARAARAVPNLLVLLALAGLAWWGHHTGWKLPRFAELMGQSAPVKDDWCPAHAVPESICVECNPALLPRHRAPGWCRVHGVHECPFEHPSVAQSTGTFHVTPAVLERARRALALLPRPKNASKCKLHLRRIQFASEEAVGRAGIDVAPVWQGPITEAVTAHGELTYDQTRVARVSSPVAGRAWRVDRAVGQVVKKGEVLALIDSLEVGKARAEFLQALAQAGLRERTVASLSRASEKGAVADATLRQARAALQEAQIRLAGAEQALANFGLPVRGDDLKGLSTAEARRRVTFLGLPEPAVKGLDARTATANLVPLLAPLDGVVVTREVVAGEVVDAAKPLFVLADTRRMWLTLGVAQEDARHVRVGQTVRFRSAALDGEVTGPVSWISTAVDPRTRTVKVRADLANPTGLVRANTFGTGRIVLREEPEAIFVPREAVQWEGDCHVVFVRDRNYLTKGAPKVFHTRTVRPGASDGGNTEIIAGVLPGEVVVARGSGVLRSELLKNNLGEG
jgi:cobalt-zinc-cadmium efflux system membrane fusion protein